MLIFLQKKANETWKLITIFSLSRRTALKGGCLSSPPCFGPYKQVFILIQDKLLILFVVEVFLFLLAYEKVAARLS